MPPQNQIGYSITPNKSIYLIFDFSDNIFPLGRIPFLSRLVEYSCWVSRFVPSFMGDGRRTTFSATKMVKRCFLLGKILILTFAGDNLLLTRKTSVFLIIYILPSPSLVLLSILRRRHHLVPILTFKLVYFDRRFGWWWQQQRVIDCHCRTFIFFSYRNKSPLLLSVPNCSDLNSH